MTEFNRASSKFYTRDLVHFKVSKAYKIGVKNDIDAWKETQKSKSEAVLPEQLPSEIFGIKCEMREYKIPDLETRKRIRAEFEPIRKEFLINLATTQRKQLEKEGLTKKQIAAMKKGKSPKGYNTHHVIPIHGGGTNDISNLCLMRVKPYHDYIHHKYINPQIRGMQDGESRKIKIPIPEGAIFFTLENEKAEIMEKKKIAESQKKLGKKSVAVSAFMRTLSGFRE